jgi:hypothetical protein
MIYAVLPVVLMAASILNIFIAFEHKFLFSLLLQNLLVVVLLFAPLYFYFRMKGENLNSILNTYLGLGDIVFIFCSIALFSTIDFLLFLTTSFFIAALSYFLIFRKTKNKSVPLAGVMSMFYIFLFVGKEFDFGFINTLIAFK